MMKPDNNRTGSNPLDRRVFLRGALSIAALVPLGASLASCATGGSSSGSHAPQATGAISAANPFGVPDNSTIDVVVFDGGYGTDYAQYAANILDKNLKVTTKVSGSTDISGELQPRFTQNNPPDAFDNSGASSIGINAILQQVEDLTPVIDAKNLEGTTIRDTLYPGVLEPGTYDGKFAALNYVMTVYAVWYSGSLFEENGWTPPKTWDEALELGAKAKEKGKYLFVWGKEAATYYQELAFTSSVKQGGDEVRLAMENLQAGAWELPAVKAVLGKIEEAVKAGYFKPGGSGTTFKDAQGQWSNDQAALLYPSGAWIENEMKDNTKSGFDMRGVPAMVVDDKSAMPYASLDAAAGEPYLVPSKGKNTAGGKEFLRVMLSKDAASNFAKTKLSPTIVKDTVPKDGFGSTALQSQLQMLDAAGENVFPMRFRDFYGINKDLLTVWNSFLDGKIDANAVSQQSQKIFDDVREDDSVTKVTVK